ncbi:hypothetical protein PPERSA_07554 [Pseudocohnilembus persalinus]|uniref:Choline transporter-like protein n=1 Tax=Pseudocohnilembus persalinus TaxID=266149 RepID=A0A0V0QZS8_PSEPJ|nr:hypothetical protein PPERSA_07554 [Pseudocohnilembus persalinus]|eukprot:KRX07804.1 hypothetical protein PPERSA_07554 [Pseudocohnilembus persalinus]
MIIQSPLKEYQQYIKPVSHKDIYEYHKKGFQLELENMGPRKAPVYLKEGPVKQRQCRDLLCLIILFFVITYQIFVLTQIGFGNTKTFLKLSKPYDYDHKQCGVGSRKGFDYIYYVTPFEGYLDRTVCVKECPNNVGIDKTPYLLCHPNSGVPKCTQQITGNYENEVMVQQTLPVIIAAPFICMGIGFIVFGIMHYFPRATTWIYLFTVMFCSGIIGEIFFYRALYGFNGNAQYPIPLMKKINTSTYAQLAVCILAVAMTGSGYYKSSKEVYYLTKRNKHRLEKAENLILSLTYTTGHFFFGIYSKSADAILIASFIDEEVEMEHFGREFVYNCPNSIRPYISQLHQAQ